jgi:hypothetical protein
MAQGRNFDVLNTVTGLESIAGFPQSPLTVLPANDRQLRLIYSSNAFKNATWLCDVRPGEQGLRSELVKRGLATAASAAPSPFDVVLATYDRLELISLHRPSDPQTLPLPLTREGAPPHAVTVRKLAPRGASLIAAAETKVVECLLTPGSSSEREITQHKQVILDLAVADSGLLAASIDATGTLIVSDIASAEMRLVAEQSANHTKAFVEFFGADGYLLVARNTFTIPNGKSHSAILELWEIPSKQLVWRQPYAGCECLGIAAKGPGKGVAVVALGKRRGSQLSEIRELLVSPLFGRVIYATDPGEQPYELFAAWPGSGGALRAYPSGRIVFAKYAAPTFGMMEEQKEHALISTASFELDAGPFYQGLDWRPPQSPEEVEELASQLGSDLSEAEIRQLVSELRSYQPAAVKAAITRSAGYGSALGILVCDPKYMQAGAPANDVDFSRWLSRFEAADLKRLRLVVALAASSVPRARELLSELAQRRIPSLDVRFTRQLQAASTDRQ